MRNKEDNGGNDCANCQGNSTRSNSHLNSSSYGSRASRHPSSDNFSKVDGRLNGGGSKFDHISANCRNKNCSNDGSNSLGNNFVLAKPINNILDGSHQFLKNRNQEHTNIFGNILRLCFECQHFACKSFSRCGSLSTNSIRKPLDNFLTSRRLIVDFLLSIINFAK